MDKNRSDTKYPYVYTVRVNKTRSTCRTSFRDYGLYSPLCLSRLICIPQEKCKISLESGSECFIGLVVDRIPNVTLSADILLLSALGDNAHAFFHPTIARHCLSFYHGCLDLVSYLENSSRKKEEKEKKREKRYKPCCVLVCLVIVDSTVQRRNE